MQKILVLDLESATEMSTQKTKENIDTFKEGRNRENNFECLTFNALVQFYAHEEGYGYTCSEPPFDGDECKTIADLVGDVKTNLTAHAERYKIIYHGSQLKPVFYTIDYNSSQEDEIHQAAKELVKALLDKRTNMPDLNFDDMHERCLSYEEIEQFLQCYNA